ncbi:MAG: hypothetical protein VX834_01470 [Myxococcota bacterium]|nr:hypothetical protein [Myxococcota bacterium]
MKHLWVTLLFACAAVLPGTTLASMVLYTPLPEMTRKSDLIVHAEVTGQKVVRDSTDRIKTLTNLRVIEPVRGATKNEQLLLSQVGGELDGVIAKVLGTSQFTVGEEIVLFGARMPDRVVMFAIGVGKYKVFTEGGKKYAISDISGDVHFVAKSIMGGVGPVKHPIPRAEELSVFLDNLRAHLKAGGAK